jgi:8-oxo-dGTP pyrophosphatase MutT (NUDIX family)
MASLGQTTYVVVVIFVGGSKASDIELVLQPEPRSAKTLFLAGSILPNEEHVDDAVRELFEATGLTLTVDDLTLLSNNHVRVPLRAGKQQLVHVFAASVPVPYVIANLRIPAKVSQAVTAQSTINHIGTYVVPSNVEIDGLTLTPSKILLLKETLRKFERLHFGYVAHWEAFRDVLIYRHVFAHDDTWLPRQLFFFTRFTVVDFGIVWMLIKGYINQL